MSPSVRQDIDALIEQQDTRRRSDFDTRDLAVYVRGLLVAMTGTWQYSALNDTVHLYRDVRWSKDEIERFRQTLETVFRVELPAWEFLCARTVGDVTVVLGKALERERRIAEPTNPAA